MVKNKLIRFINRKIVDKKNQNIKLDFDMESFRSILSKNSTIDFEILKFIWENYGLTSFKEGLFWTINPYRYQEIVRQFENVTNEAVPFIRTVTGCLFIWDFYDEEYVITYLDVHSNKLSFYADRMEDLFNYDIISNALWDRELNGKRERLALNTFSDIESDECVVPVPAIVAGGEFSEETLKKEKVLEHLHLLSELHLKL